MGSFSLWKDPVNMINTGHEFTRILVSSLFANINQKLERGIHYFKFIVDGEWRFDPDLRSCQDAQGNINNVLDTEEHSLEI